MTLTAYNHIPIPSFMYGTAWKKEATTSLVLKAVEAGFTAIDTANQLVHYDEARVGDALEQLAQRGIARSRLFLQTKFTPLHGQDHRLPYDPRASLGEQVRQSFASSLDHLHTDYLDSYVLHGPYSRRGLGREDWEVWAAIESLYDAGKTKMIGISNVSAEQLTLLCERAKHKPMVVQNRCYAALGWDKNVREICRRHGIIYQGFSLLTANRAVLIDHRIRAMTARYQATPAQLVFRFALQVGMLPLTGTTNPEHMKEDLLLDRFTLSAEDIRHIESIGDS
ncbi:aldo/keto reductase family protein [Candidatus Nitrospira inopinata]|jgi:diketogulonate reductase-like aldo/keto reductase|uniref:Putative 2,5-diketo-D-gluconic acid reductase n=1 Tax=Candidatus Nitrospira inopinata TaxID=1715989 RepID=A0A0S4KYZ1_9BACT|nr:aldo/keto reductase [Candidatus Nitrospira inopinata]CUQ67659.1 putative 2,5-diketo-D-gluconic acid reductase [Candidatus Nitrospira inopinata]